MKQHTDKYYESLENLDFEILSEKAFAMYRDWETNYLQKKKEN